MRPLMGVVKTFLFILEFDLILFLVELRFTYTVAHFLHIKPFP